MAKVFWDTNLFIYLFEDKPNFGGSVHDLRRRMLQRDDQLYTSAMTVGEVLVKPEKAGNIALMDRYLSFFSSPQITVLPFDFSVVANYARIRQDRGIQAADAIQLACASSGEIDLFITNDERLSQKCIPGVKFLTSLSRAPI
jgi:predicted nucleic acid-binding protein